jgi:hypothetical protein
LAAGSVQRPRTPPLISGSSVPEYAFVPTTGKTAQILAAEAAAAAATAANPDNIAAAKNTTFPTLVGTGAAATGAAALADALQGSKTVKVVAKKGKKPAAVAQTRERQLCGCAATEHDLYANCTACGRILCVLEGEGACPFCESFVTVDYTLPNEEFAAVITDTAQEAFEGRMRRNGARSGAQRSADRAAAKAAKAPARAPAGRRRAVGEEEEEGPETTAYGDDEPAFLDCRAFPASEAAFSPTTAADRSAPKAGSSSSLTNTAAASAAAAAASGALPEDPEHARRAAGLAAARAHRDKLLHRAAVQGHRPHVIDEQADFYDFEGNAWLSEAEREVQRRRAEEAEDIIARRQRERTMDIDLFSGAATVARDEAMQFGFAAGGAGRAHAEVAAEVERRERRRAEAETGDREGAGNVTDAARAFPTLAGAGSVAAVASTETPTETATSTAGGASAGGRWRSAGGGSSGEGARAAIVARLMSNDTLHGRAKAVYDALQQSIASARADKDAQQQQQQQQSLAQRMAQQQASQQQQQQHQQARSLASHVAESSALAGGARAGARARLQHDQLPTVAGEDAADQDVLRRQGDEPARRGDHRRGQDDDGAGAAAADGFSYAEGGRAAIDDFVTVVSGPRARKVNSSSALTKTQQRDAQKQARRDGLPVSAAVETEAVAVSNRFGALDDMLEGTVEAASFVGPQPPGVSSAAAPRATQASRNASAAARGTRFNIPASAFALAEALEADADATASAGAAGKKAGPYEPLDSLHPRAAASAAAPPGTLARMLLDGATAVYCDAEDGGVCLSMHQPWASLLVQGIKRFEGRPWFSAHKGRLWIAATSRKPEPEEIAELEGFYRRVYGESAKIPFPKQYPHAALLGCVDMVGCWGAEDMAAYSAAHPNWCVEPNESRHVFVCAAPRALAAPVSMSGDHKLWSLPGNMHRGLRDQLKPVGDAWLKEALGLTGAAADKGSRTIKELQRETVERRK